MTRGYRHGSVCRSLRVTYLFFFLARRFSYLAEWASSGHAGGARLYPAGDTSSEGRHQKKSA